MKRESSAQRFDTSAVENVIDFSTVISTIENIPALPDGKRKYVMDKKYKELGWGPTTMFKDGIVLTIDWYLSEEGRKWTEECTSGEYLNWIEKNYTERN